MVRVVKVIKSGGPLLAEGAGVTNAFAYVRWQYVLRLLRIPSRPHGAIPLDGGRRDGGGCEGLDAERVAAGVTQRRGAGKASHDSEHLSPPLGARDGREP